MFFHSFIFLISLARLTFGVAIGALQKEPGGVGRGEGGWGGKGCGWREGSSSCLGGGGASKAESSCDLQMRILSIRHVNGAE